MDPLTKNGLPRHIGEDGSKPSFDPVSTYRIGLRAALGRAWGLHKCLPFTGLGLLGRPHSVPTRSWRSSVAATSSLSATHRVSVECPTHRTVLFVLYRQNANTPAQDRSQLGVAELVNGAVVVDRRVDYLHGLAFKAVGDLLERPSLLVLDRALDKLLGEAVDSLALVLVLRVDAVQFTGRFLLQQMVAVAELEAGMISARTKAALAAAKRRGVKLGGNRGVKPTAKMQNASKAALQARADARAADIGPTIKELQAAGATSLRAIADRLRAMNITPHVAQYNSAGTSNRQSAIDRRTTRHDAYAMSQSCRAMVECIFGWGKQHGTMRKTKHRGIARVTADFMLNLIAYNLIRVPKLIAA